MLDNDFYGTNHAWFAGVVAESVDETYVRVRIYGIHPIYDKTKVADNDLPLALVAYATSGGNSTHDLEQDDWVIGFFIDYPRCQKPIVTHKIEGTGESMSGYDKETGDFVPGQNDRNTSDSTTSNDSDTSDVSTTGTTNLTGGGNVEKSYNYIYDKLKSEGVSDPHMLTSAWIGGMRVEHYPMDPAIEGGYKGRAWGICQWLGSRKAQLFKKYGRTKRLDHQLDFMWWELNNTEKGAKRKWLAATNMPDAVEAMSLFERAEDHNLRTGTIMRGHSVYKKRLKYAYEIYNTIKHTPTNTMPTQTKLNPGQL